MLLDKWFLKNQPIIDLDKIARACWNALTALILNLVKVIHYDTMPDTAVNILWENLPMRPADITVDRKYFIKYYELYLLIFGTRPAINTTKTYFALDYFEVINLRYFEYASLYPKSCLRIRMTWDESKIAAIQSYIAIIAPARCKFNTQLLPPEATGGFGDTPFGDTFGN